ncbi:MAG: RNA helicase [Chloroflexi bacterium]|nr:RNA helicase [Chloroflexota bacterium]HCU81067.1 RNA helicase [Chloroflexota bacterium]|tara:strand:+ start:345 stop:1589 length:1245 start_codon:yes stop_codon:yes gene_type:complete
MTFNQFSLDKRIMDAIKTSGYTTPTPIQSRSIPKILQGHDVMGLAQTGTGKTAAFTIPIIQNLLTRQQRQLSALILAPTRELAEQIHLTSVSLGKGTGLRSIAIYGGVSKNSQISKLRKGINIAIACPGRLLDLVGDKHIDLSHINILVLDEADRMCDMGFIPDIRRIIKLLPTQRQTLFFAATMPEDIKRLTNKILTKPVRIQVGKMTPTKSVAHTLYPVPQALKKSLLFEMLKQTPTGRLLIFTRTKYRARNLARDLAKRGYRAQALQGNMSQNQRQRAIDGFRGNKYDILVATDVASRGIDVLDISHVINYDIPDSSETYIHRIGRTGRANKTGEAFTFASTEDTKLVREIEQALGSPIERRTLQDFKYGNFVPEKQFQGKYSKQKPSALSRRRRRKRRTRHKPKKTRTRH